MLLSSKWCTSIPSPRLMALLFLFLTLHDPHSSAFRKKKIVLLERLVFPFVKCLTKFPLFSIQTAYLSVRFSGYILLSRASPLTGFQIFDIQSVDILLRNYCQLIACIDFFWYGYWEQYCNSNMFSYTITAINKKKFLKRKRINFSWRYVPYSIKKVLK